MILPIKLTGKPGLPGQGVPSFSLDPTTGQVIGAEFWPQGSLDPSTGEPATSSIDYADHPGLWTGGSAGQSFGTNEPNTLNPAAIWDYRGSQWRRRGSYQTESPFDKWRRAGKPTRCAMSGIGDTLPDGTPCDPGSSPYCLSTAQRIALAIADAAHSAAYPQIQPYPYQPGGVQAPAGGGQVTVSGGASPMAWVFGGLIVVGLVYAVNRR